MKQACGEVKMSLRKHYTFLKCECTKGCKKIGNNILQGHRLSQVFVVMAFVREQQQKLRWIKNHQKQIRAKSYQTFKRNVQSNTKTGEKHGKSFILPALHY